VLIHDQSLVFDARVGWSIEGRLLRRLEGPAPVRVVPNDWPKVASMVAPKVIVPAVGLILLLQVVTRAATVLLIPCPLVDRETVAPPLVGQLLHVAPDVHGLRWVKLPDLEVARWI